MPRRLLFSALLALLLGPWLAAQQPAARIAVAAAADLRGALEELKDKFEASRPVISLQLTYGASGSLTAQIQQGAPFDLFLSADMAYPAQLARADLVAENGSAAYAVGQLVLWVRKDLGLDPVKDGMRLLLDPAVKHIALANPQLAPYGRAGEATLRHAGLYEAVQGRLVFAENVAQAAQYLQTGAAEAGLISFSQAEHPALRESGLHGPVPPDSHPPLLQGFAVLKRTRHLAEARAFTAFLMGPEGQAILARHGFGRPASGRPASGRP